ncbi:hypothetical protein ACD591_09085 [Rufibacter glacialis]|uniref:DUF4595 domain-containing protein n=1 Tax=Rufibacter glacialis TaxID=1259555 RepID=A0A5M8QD98_9BACT|nr:hypothetical protein [Rufibacter glacialis]KAA6432412.1 hypothetical protein FOE74_15025 [Rufibacter glacialis]GGK78449.1 hypothetical protein GCM10011405_27890 [Rufibacter glacialis]
MAKLLRTYLTLSCFLFLLGGCSGKKEEDPAPTPEPEVVLCRLLKEEVVSPNPSQTFTRDYMYVGLDLTGVEDVYPQNPASSSTIAFGVDVAGKIVSTTIFRNGTVFQYYLFEHDAQGLISRVDLYARTGPPGSQPVKMATREHTYNAKKQLISSKNYQVTGGAPRLLNDFTFTYNDKGNLTEVREYRAFNFQSSGAFNDIVIKTTYTHDDKINPYHEYPSQNYLPPGLVIQNMSPNNILTVTSMTTTEGTTHGPGATFDTAALNFTGTNTYTYTANNRPAKVTGSLGVTRTFTYACAKVTKP